MEALALRALALAGLLLSVMGFGAALVPAAEEPWSTRVPAGALEVDPIAAAPLPWGSPELGTDATAPVFGGEVRVSNTDRIGEPAVKIGKNGVVYVHAPGRLWRSTDGGASFTKVTLTGTVLTGVVTCGCDADVAVDDLNNVFYADLAFPNCVNVGMSPDKGDHWLANRYACNLDYGAGMDRQWLETDGKLHTYLTYRIGGAIHLSLAPASPAPAFASLGQVNQQGSNFRAGYLAVDKASDTAYLTYTSGNSVRVVVVKGGLPVDDRLVAPTGGSPNDSFSAAAVDNAGNAYVVWTERATVAGAQVAKSMLAVSTDGGQTWSAPVKVNQAATTSVWPWIVAGAEGRIGIVHYGSMDARLPGSVTGDWFVYYVYSDNAHTASRSFTEVLAVPHKVKTGPLCTQGTGCASGTRTFLDFFGVHLFPDGRAGIAFNDQEALAGNQAPYVHFAQQVDGPRLL